MAKHESDKQLPDAKHASLGVLQDLHGILRQSAAESLTAAAVTFIDTSRRVELGRWLRVHLGTLREPEGLSPDLKRFLASDPGRASALTTWMFEKCEERSASPQWCKSHIDGTLADAFHSEEQFRRDHNYDGGIVFGRQQLLTWLLEVCISDDFDFSVDENRKAVEILVGAGLGLVFIRYSQANRESYYHWLLCDLLPVSTWETITDRLSVPEGAGTIGWILQDVIAAGVDGNLLPKSKTLHSTFLDPKGRVAFEDELIGNRSITAIPILDASRAPVGVVFSFFPVDGFFTYAHQMPFAPNVANFFSTFEHSVSDSHNELLLSLELEGATKLYEVASRRSSTGALFGEGQDFVTNAARQRWLKEALAPDARGVADPLGFQLAIEVRQKREKAGSEVKILDSAVYLREETFANQLFSVIQLACQRPFRWAPLITLSLRALHQVYHQYDRHGQAVDLNAELVPIPTWHCRTGDIGVPRLDALYPPEVVERLKSLRQSLRGSVKTLSELKDKAPSDQVVKDLDVGLCLHSPPNHVIDLVVPLLATKTPRNNGHRWCAGFLRIKCVVASDVREGRPLDDEEVDRLRFLYRFIVDREEHVTRIANLLESFEDVLRAASDQRLGFEQLKTILDLRYVFCRAVAAELANAFAGSTPGNSFELAAKLVGQLEKKEDIGGRKEWRVFTALARDVSSCKRAVALLCAELRELIRSRDSASPQLPDVTLASVWLARTKPIIAGHSGTLCHELDRQLFYVDRGASNFLDLVLRLSRLNPANPVNLDLNVLHAEHSVWPDKPSLMVVPQVFYKPDPNSHLLARFDRMTCATERDGLKSTTELFDGDDSIRIDWQWDRFPEPVSFALVPGRMTYNLLRSVHCIGSSNLSPEVLDLRIGSQTQLPLSRIFADTGARDLRDRDGKDQVIPHRLHLNTLVTFMAGDRDQVDEPRWRVAGLSAGDREGAIIVYGHSDVGRGNTTLSRLRFAAIEGAQAEYARLLRDIEVGASTKLRELQSWTRHLLGNAFEALSTRIEDIADAYHQDPTAAGLIEKLWGQCRNLQCLVESATGKERDTLLNNYRDFGKLLTSLWEWYPCAVNKPIAGECNLPEARSNDSFEFDLRCVRMLYMVLANMLDNAVKQAFRAPNGKINLRCTIGIFDFGHQEGPKDERRGFKVEIENTGRTMEHKFAAYLRGQSDVIPTRGKQYRRGLLTIRRLLEESHLPLPLVEAPLENGVAGTRISLLIPRENFYTAEAEDE